MLDVQVAWLVNAGMNYLYSGDLGRLGNAHPNIVPYQVFATGDGYIVVAIGNDGQFRRFCAMVGRNDLAEDARFATNDGRVRNRDSCIAALRPVFAARTSADWLAALEAEGIGCGPINRLDQVFDDPHVEARGMVADVPHPAIGGAPARLIATPLRLSETPAGIRLPPPVLGEHTEEVLGEVLGCGEAEIDELRAAGAIG